MLQVVADEVAEAADVIAEEDQVAGSEAGRFEFGVEGVGEAGPVAQGGVWSGGLGVESDGAVAPEGFGDGQDGDALVIRLQFAEVLGVRGVGGGDDGAGVLTHRPAGRVADDADGGKRRREAPFSEAAVKAKRQRLEGEGPLRAVRARERDRLSCNGTKLLAAKLHGEVAGRAGGWCVARVSQPGLLGILPGREGRWTEEARVMKRAPGDSGRGGSDASGGRSG